ncbi:uncharacterized protein BXZ73DRAFT_73387 [Epithele typhae]|uniref:uncharacterized protein n=1 Tax=Epithele typhae TaxID=378194 RepID=UPI002007D515|nr:uncharacterized protein BXZ73DRAFT_73387 [Epithele typhae]KAH9945203.1 hypothetical protein BXZ73DRAFT_73387 [Epithele typhae]
MSKAEPTRAQLSSRLSYQAKVPAFLARMKGLGGGGRGDDKYDDDEFEDDGSGRPPIPRRPAIPTRPDDEQGSADEDDGDETPQIVVLKEGKHLSRREVENEKRKAKGLPPLPEHDEKDEKTKEEKPKQKDATNAITQGLSFSSGGAKGKGTKRKAVGDGRDEAVKPESSKGGKKKSKKQDKKLLSFDEDA